MDSVEIERKFLVADDAFLSFKEYLSRIKQGYLARRFNKTVRVRITDQRCMLTYESEVIRATPTESEIEIPRELAEYFMAMCEPKIVEKDRFTLIDNGKNWIVDVFKGRNEGLVLAAIELETEEEDFAIPEWCVKEVTHLRRYCNEQLAIRPYNEEGGCAK